MKSIVDENLNISQIKIKYLRGIEPLKRIIVGDLIDLKTAEDITLREGEYKAIPLGVAMELPKGFEAWVIPRSSTFKNYGILQANSVGLIDESYCGDNDEWHFPAYATRDIHIPKGTRICQFRIMKHQPDIELIPVEVLGNEDRKGFGSTGRN